VADNNFGLAEDDLEQQNIISVGIQTSKCLLFVGSSHSEAAIFSFKGITIYSTFGEGHRVLHRLRDLRMLRPRMLTAL